VIQKAELAERAAAAYLALAELAETIEDEWEYVTDLTDAYLVAIRALADVSSAEPAPADMIDAVDLAIAEIALITDPHKAIDWLSTFPHVVALAFGGEVDEPEGAAFEGAADDTPEAREPGDESPFRILRLPDR
jgi:hypothetical protein